jgi:hypothetical protein
MSWDGQRRTSRSPDLREQHQGGLQRTPGAYLGVKGSQVQILSARPKTAGQRRVDHQVGPPLASPGASDTATGCCTASLMGPSGRRLAPRQVAHDSHRGSWPSARHGAFCVALRTGLSSVLRRPSRFRDGHRCPWSPSPRGRTSRCRLTWSQSCVPTPGGSGPWRGSPTGASWPHRCPIAPVRGSRGRGS